MNPLVNIINKTKTISNNNTVENNFISIQITTNVILD